MGSDMDPQLSEFETEIPDSSLELDAEQKLPFPFCFHYNNRPWSTIVVYAQSPDAAANSAAAVVGRFNRLAPSLGYPPLFSAVAGACALV